MSARCGVCGGHGYVVKKQKSEVKLECMSCRTTWVKESKICPNCARPNGYAVDGLCAQCYAHLYK
jgi:hypothetical protein